MPRPIKVQRNVFRYVKLFTKESGEVWVKIMENNKVVQ